MLDVLTRAGCFITIIILGFVLKRFGFFKEDAFDTLSKVTIKITLPASIVISFSQMEIAVPFSKLILPVPQKNLNTKNTFPHSSIIFIPIAPEPHFFQRS